jgi:uncharacterized protein involved in outer membrane biogenesis
MTSARPRRRWLRWVAVALLVVVAWFAATAWVLSRDRDRVAALVSNAVGEATGLEVEVGGAADVSWWPPGVRLGDVSLSLPGGAPLARAEALGASVPWSVLWTRQLVLRRIELDGLQVDLDALSALPTLRAGDGPPAPLRWPKLGERFVVRDAQLLRAGAAPIVVTLEVEPIAIDTNVHFAATVALSGRTHRIRVDGIAKDDGGIALVPADIDVDGIGFDGTLRIAGASAWSADGRLVAAAAPPWLEEFLAGAAPRAPIDLEIAVARAEGQAALRAAGKLGGATVDADLTGLELPRDGGIAAWLALATDPALRGNAKLDRWTIGETTLEGIELRAGEEATE